MRTAETGKPNEPCQVTDIGPRGDMKPLPVKKTPEGYETLYAPLEVGPHMIKVEYAGKEVPKSPFPVQVQPKGKEAPVKVKGLEARKWTRILYYWFNCQLESYTVNFLFQIRLLQLRSFKAFSATFRIIMFIEIYKFILVILVGYTLRSV